jgi:hypothetical protein
LNLQQQQQQQQQLWHLLVAQKDNRDLRDT